MTLTHGKLTNKNCLKNAISSIVIFYYHRHTSPLITFVPRRARWRFKCRCRFSWCQTIGEFDFALLWIREKDACGNQSGKRPF